MIDSGERRRIPRRVPVRRRESQFTSDWRLGDAIIVNPRSAKRPPVTAFGARFRRTGENQVIIIRIGTSFPFITGAAASQCALNDVIAREIAIARMH